MSKGKEEDKILKEILETQKEIKVKLDKIETRLETHIEEIWKVYGPIKRQIQKFKLW
tara:strand:+ start:16579 stop:16749 length:171 start_codon:yes stop_codon:yes gene_type:complete